MIPYWGLLGADETRDLPLFRVERAPCAECRPSPLLQNGLAVEAIASDKCRFALPLDVYIHRSYLLWSHIRSLFPGICDHLVRITPGCGGRVARLDVQVSSVVCIAIIVLMAYSLGHFCFFIHGCVLCHRWMRQRKHGQRASEPVAAVET
jgi:hypothetical protein